MRIADLKKKMLILPKAVQSAIYNPQSAIKDPRAYPTASAFACTNKPEFPHFFSLKLIYYGL
jgi:hypothetical protein